MHASGIAFYCERPSLSPIAPLPAILECIGTSQVTYVTRSTMEDQEVAHWLRGEYVDHEEVQEGGDALEACRHFQADRSLTFSMRQAPIVAELEAAAARDIPLGIRGETVLDSCLLKIGGHDILDFGGVDRPLSRVARAEFSLTFASASSPLNWARYREEVFQTPEAILLRRCLERSLGPLRTWATWAV